MSDAPRSYQDFIARYPELKSAWDLVRKAEDQGSFDDRTRRLLKLAIAVGAGRPGAISSSTRKALKAGVTPDELEQVIALGVSTVGFPASVAAFQDVREAAEKAKG